MAISLHFNRFRRLKAMPWPALAKAAALPAGALLLLAFLGTIVFPLLSSPHRFPAGGDPEIAARAIADTEIQGSWERSTGEISYFDPDLGGRNRAADRSAFYTQPVFYLLSRVLPAGLSLSLTVFLYASFLGIGAHALAFRLGFRGAPALIAGAGAMACGGALTGLLAPERLGSAAPAAMVPFLALLGRSLLRNPTCARAALFALTAAAASAGADFPALVAAFLLSILFGGLLEKKDGISPRRHGVTEEDERETNYGRRGALAVLGALVLGLSLSAYRELPLLLGDPAGFLGLREIASGPWWLEASGHIRLPFFLGAIALILIAAAIVPGSRSPRDLALAAGALIFAALTPGIFFPSIGLPLALAGAAGARRLGGLLGGRLPIGSLLILAFLLEAGTHHREALVTRSIREVAAAPEWVEFIGKRHGGERAAILGEGEKELKAALSMRGILRAPAIEASDLNRIEDLSPLAYLGAKYIVSDLPDSRKRLPFLQRCRKEGKYIYLNHARLGPAYWTQRIEITSGAPGPAPSPFGGLSAPKRMGAVLLDSSGGAADLPGEAYGTIRSVRRLPNGLRLTADLPGEAYLVLTEPFLAGMTARADGRPVPLIRANSTQIGLRLPEGRHEVVIEYRPPGLAAGSALSAVGLLVLAVLLALPVIAALGRRRDAGRMPRISRPAQRPRIAATSLRVLATWSGR